MNTNRPDPDNDFEDINTDEENPGMHDQLPSPEEYKARMDGSSNTFGRRDMDPPEDGEATHDLPGVDEYKQSMSFRESEEREPKSRAGLYAFLCLVLLLIIVTAIAVPLALRGKSKGNAVDESNGGGLSTPGNSNPNIITSTSTPVSIPTRPPTRPPTISDLPRNEAAVKYLTDLGLASKDALNDPSTPQAKATNWIADEDDFDIDIPEPSSSDSRFTERWALAVFYYSTGGDDWRYKMKFLQPVDHCNWYDRFIDPTGNIIRQGVTECQKFAPSFAEDKISKIEISNNNLKGNIPSEIKFLPYLRTWITPFNVDLGKSLEPFIPLSQSLSHLELQYCHIEGAIPDGFGSMSLLSFLGLGNNLLTGSIPASFFGLTNLLVLGLDDNLLESEIDLFAKLNQMQKLYIEDNLIKGQITEEMISGGWKEMVDLDVSVNRLEGPIPANIWSMGALEVVDLHGNDFLGTIPPIESVHENLFFLALQDNSLNMQIPETINNLINLKHLDVSANRLSLPFPATMSQMKNMVSLYTGINGFGDHPVPDFIQSMTNLRELSMKQNSLTGEIPTFLGGLSNLQVLDLDFNKLRGAIPFELGRLSSLDMLMLNRNFLTGTIPRTFLGLNDIDVILLDGNEITGNASAICDNPDVNTTAFSADCGQPNPEIECSCCSICCHDGDADCNNFDWRVNLDGIWEYDFQRVVYSFSQEILPSSAKEDYTDDGDDGER